MSDFGSSQIERKNEENMMSNHQTEQADVSHPSKGWSAQPLWDRPAFCGRKNTLEDCLPHQTWLVIGIWSFLFVFYLFFVPDHPRRDGKKENDVFRFTTEQKLIEVWLSPCKAPTLQVHTLSPHVFEILLRTDHPRVRDCAAWHCGVHELLPSPKLVILVFGHWGHYILLPTQIWLGTTATMKSAKGFRLGLQKFLQIVHV